MGWAVYDDVAAMAALPERHFANLPKGVSFRQIIGNSMHLGCMTMVLACALACVGSKSKDEGMEAQWAEEFATYVNNAPAQWADQFAMYVARGGG
jgi:hypothetical protein